MPNKGSFVVLCQEEGKPAPAPYPTIVKLPFGPDHSKVKLKVVVRNLEDNVSGIIHGVFLGNRSQINNRNYSLQLWCMAWLSIYFIFGFYHTFMFLFQRKDKASLFFGLFCFHFGSFYLFQFNYSAQVVGFPSFQVYNWFFDATWMLIPVTFSLYISSLFPQVIPKYFVRTCLIFPFCYYGSTLVLPSHFRGNVLPVAHLFILSSLVFLTVKTLLVPWKKKAEAKLFGFCLLFLFAGVLHDILAAYALFMGVYVINYVFASFIIANGILIAINYSRASREFSKSRQLKRDINLAQDIAQHQEVSEKTGYCDLRTFYKSADDCGGDWYIVESTDQRTYFFMADVTGHGLHSALITLVVSSAIRAALTIAISKRQTVEEVLRECTLAVNKAVYSSGRKIDRIATMSLNCIDHSTGVLYHINAGHKPLLIRRGSKVSPFINPNNLVGLQLDSKFKVKTRQLSKNDLIFVYTDGLVENQEGIIRSTDKQLMQALEKGGLDELKEKLVKGFVSEANDDDIAFLIIQWNGNEKLAIA